MLIKSLLFIKLRANANIHDIKVCKQLIKELDVNIKTNSKLVGDKDYISKRRVYKTKNKYKKYLIVKNIKTIFIIYK